MVGCIFEIFQGGEHEISQSTESLCPWSLNRSSKEFYRISCLVFDFCEKSEASGKMFST